MLSRRSFLIGGSCLLANSFLNTPAEAAPLPQKRWVHIKNANTGETLKQYYYNGGYLKSGVQNFSWFGRDWRRNEAILIHPWLMDMLFILHSRFSTDQIILTSLYRSKKTNAALEGAAKNSLHTKGLAMDIIIPGINSLTIAKTLRATIPGGVGWYPDDGFVHADLGNRRSWVG